MSMKIYKNTDKNVSYISQFIAVVLVSVFFSKVSLKTFRTALGTSEIIRHQLMHLYTVFQPYMPNYTYLMLT